MRVSQDKFLHFPPSVKHQIKTLMINYLIIGKKSARRWIHLCLLAITWKPYKQIHQHSISLLLGFSNMFANSFTI